LAGRAGTFVSLGLWGPQGACCHLHVGCFPWVGGRGAARIRGCLDAALTCLRVARVHACMCACLHTHVPRLHACLAACLPAFLRTYMPASAHAPCACTYAGNPAHACTCVCVCACMCVYVCGAALQLCLCLCVYVHVFVCMSADMCMRTFVCMHVLRLCACGAEIGQGMTCGGPLLGIVPPRSCDALRELMGLIDPKTLPREASGRQVCRAKAWVGMHACPHGLGHPSMALRGRTGTWAGGQKNTGAAGMARPSAMRVATPRWPKARRRLRMPLRWAGGPGMAPQMALQAPARHPAPPGALPTGNPPQGLAAGQWPWPRLDSKACVQGGQGGNHVPFLPSPSRMVDAWVLSGGLLATGVGPRLQTLTRPVEDTGDRRRQLWPRPLADKGSCELGRRAAETGGPRRGLQGHPRAHGSRPGPGQAAGRCQRQGRGEGRRGEAGVHAGGPPATRLAGSGSANFPPSSWVRVTTSARGRGQGGGADGGGQGQGRGHHAGDWPPSWQAPLWGGRGRGGPCCVGRCPTGARGRAA
jgi:hypothetical protein